MYVTRFVHGMIQASIIVPSHTPKMSTGTRGSDFSIWRRDPVVLLLTYGGMDEILETS